MTDPRAVDLLVRYDRASEEELAALEADPVTAAILGRLRAVDQFLVTGGLSRSNVAADPTADEQSVAAVTSIGTITPDELYAHGGGPDSLPAARTAEEIESHLGDHPRERRWVASLRDNPLSSLSTGAPIAPQRTGSVPPLEWDPIEDESPRALDAAASQTLQVASVGALRAVSEANEAPAAKRAIPGWVAWTPLAAAALVLAMALSGTSGRDFDAGLPDSPVMRSARTTALLFPRGRLMEAPEDGTSYASAPIFEVTPVRDASEYRFEIRRGGESAFDEGNALWSGTSREHTAQAPPLEVGAYRWQAWAIVNELEQPLGNMVIQVVPRDDVRTSVASRASAAEAPIDEDTLRGDVRALHAAGFVTDARFRARQLPPSRERDHYLGLE